MILNKICKKITPIANREKKENIVNNSYSIHIMTYESKTIFVSNFKQYPALKVYQIDFNLTIITIAGSSIRNILFSFHGLRV